MLIKSIEKASAAIRNLFSSNKPGNLIIHREAYLPGRFHAVSTDDNSVFTDKEISTLAFRVAFELSRHKSEEFKITVLGLAYLTGLNEKSIKRALIELEESGYLSRYEFRDPETKKKYYFYEFFELRKNTKISKDSNSLKKAGVPKATPGLSHQRQNDPYNYINSNQLNFNQNKQTSNDDVFSQNSKEVTEPIKKVKAETKFTPEQSELIDQLVNLEVEGKPINFARSYAETAVSKYSLDVIKKQIANLPALLEANKTVQSISKLLFSAISRNYEKPTQKVEALGQIRANRKINRINKLIAEINHSDGSSADNGKWLLKLIDEGNTDKLVETFRHISAEIEFNTGDIKQILAQTIRLKRANNPIYSADYICEENGQEVYELIGVFNSGEV